MAEMLSVQGNEWLALESHLREGMFANFESDFARYMLPNPYEYATIRSIDISPSAVLPTAKYVLKSNLETVAYLYTSLLREGYDIFNLHGILNIDADHDICPPILEIWDEPPYNNIPVIVDGAHRLYLAKLLGIPTVKCVVISGNIAHMLPVLPLTGWEEVHVCSEVPKDKRNYHPLIPTNIRPHELYRTPFPGSTGVRSVVSQLPRSGEA